MKVKYEKLDAEIFSAVSSGASRFADVCTPRVSSDAAEFVTAGRPCWRVVDSRLQALRRAGKIKWSRLSGWEKVQ